MPSIRKGGVQGVGWRAISLGWVQDACLSEWFKLTHIGKAEFRTTRCALWTLRKKVAEVKFNAKRMQGLKLSDSF